MVEDKLLLQLCDFEALELDLKCYEKRRRFNFFELPFGIFFFFFNLASLR